ncbi:MAG: hypothetical protein ACKO5X_00485 [Limnohabitans sp.]
MNKISRRQPSKNLSCSTPTWPVKSMCFNELAMRYLVSHACILSEPIFKVRIEHLSQQLLSFFGLQLISDIRPERLQKFIYVLEGKGLEPRKIQSCLLTFRVCMKYAFNQKWVLDPALTKPLLSFNHSLLPDETFMSASEYQVLYQDLVQEVTRQTFH